MPYLPEIPLQSPPRVGSPYSAAGMSRGRRRRRREAGAVQRETSATPDLARAVELNRRYGPSLGWLAHRPRIAAVIGFTSYTPDELAFARALAVWQGRNGLTPDGILGPRTWGVLASRVSGARPGTTPAPSAPPATPGPAFLKDSPRLRAVSLAPSDPVTIATSWSSDKQAIARTYNRLGGLMRALAGELGFEVAAALAVWRVESGGREHTPGQMIIRFENHVLYRYWGEKNRALYDQHFRHGGHNGHPGRSWEGHQFRETPSGAFQTLHTGAQANEYRALQLAIRLAGDTIALQCISMGGPQVMGFNHGKLGYASPRAMYDAFQADERFHVLGFFDFCRETSAPARGDLVRHLRERNWNEFARYYNGSGQVATYGALIARNIQEAVSLPSLARELEFEFPGDAVEPPPLPPPDDPADAVEDAVEDAADAVAGNGAAPPEDPAPPEPPAWITADGFVLRLPPVVLQRIIARSEPPGPVPPSDADPTRQQRPRRKGRAVKRRAKAGVRRGTASLRRKADRTKKAGKKIVRRVGRLAGRARRVGTLRDRATGRELPVFAGRDGAYRYRIVASPGNARDAEILEIAAELDELEIPADGQLTPSFNIREFYSGIVGQSGKTDPVPSQYHANVLELARNLQVLRDHLGKSIRINSGYRNPAYNKHIGGASDSQHLYAKAGDLHVDGVTPSQVYCTIEGLIAAGKMKQGGLGIYNTFVHYDIRGSAARWKGDGASYPNCSTLPLPQPVPGSYLPPAPAPGPDPSGDAARRARETGAVRRWVRQGITDEARLTDLVFYGRHPELNGRKLRSGETKLAQEWVSIRDSVVRPVLRSSASAPAAPAPTSSSSWWADPLEQLSRWLRAR